MDSTTLAHDQSTGVDTAFVFDDVPAFLCCCSILNEALGPDQHLDDCELQHLKADFSHSFIDGDSTDAMDSHTSDDSKEPAASKRRKHRESMARLRQNLRESIDTLKLQERQLSRTLERSVAQFQATSVSQQSQDSPSSDARLQLRQAYFELVQEQLALQGERRSLDATWLQKDAYERLVQRELQRMQAATEVCPDEDQQS